MTDILAELRRRAYGHEDRDLLDSAAAEIRRLRTEVAETKDDALRLHRDKMAFYDAALALVHAETIKNVCGWYPQIEAFRKLLGMASVNV